MARGVRAGALSALVALVLTGCGGGSSAGAGSGHATPGGGAPEFARTVELRLISGSVRVSPPGNGVRSFALIGARLVPVGTVVDTRLGDVRMTTALPSAGRTDVGDFTKGVFRIEQRSGGGGLTDLTVLDQQTVPAACSGTGSHRHLSPSQLGLLLGTARGGFRTDGEFAAATVRGTKWGVRNRCDGTLTVDREGVVLVTVYHPHRVLTLHTGQTFLARAR